MKNLRAWFAENKFTTVKEGAEKLTEELGISVKEYEEEGLFVLNYSQINSPKMHPVVIECRGLIVDNNLNPICVSFDRFFNMGEALEITEDFDYKNAEFFEKADGSLIKVYYFGGLWRIATRGTAFAESANYTGVTFERLVLDAFGCIDMDDFQHKMSSTPKAFTHIFEYVSPKNRVVTPYKKDEMVLLGIRGTATGTDLSDHDMLDEVAYEFKEVKQLNVRAAKSYYFKSKEELLKAVQKLPGLQEGFVCYSKGQRIKVKSELYVQVHKLRGNNIPTPKRIAELVVTNEAEEYLAYFPEDREMFQPYEDVLITMIAEAEALYNDTSSVEGQKEFALKIKDKIYAGVLFATRKKDSHVIDEFMNLPVNKRAKMLLAYKEVQ